MNETLVSLVQANISSAMKASEFYKELSSMAPNPTAQYVLMNMSKDEEKKAYQFNELHRELMVSNYYPIMTSVEIKGGFKENLLRGIDNELVAYREFSANIENVSNEKYIALAGESTVLNSIHAIQLLAMYVTDDNTV